MLACQKGPKMSLALNEPKLVDLHSKFKHYLGTCATSENILLILYANKEWKIIGDQLPKEGPIEFKNSSNVPKQLFEICSLLPLCPGCKNMIHLPQACYDILTSSPISVQGSSILDLLLRSWI